MKKLTSIKKAKALVLASLAGLAIASTAHAQLINFEVPTALGGNAYSGPAAIGSSGDFWNAVPGAFALNSQGAYTGGTTSGDFLSDDLTSSPITLTLGSSQYFSKGGQGAVNPISGNPDALEGPFLYNSGSPITGSLNNVATGTYNLFLYVANFNTQAQFDKVDSGTISVNGGTPVSYANIQGSTSFTAGADYLEFAGVTPSTGTISFSIASTGEVDFNGLQLQAVTAPEPSSYALMLGGLGVLALALHRRRLNA